MFNIKFFKKEEMEKEDPKSKLYLVVFGAMLLVALVLTVSKMFDKPSSEEYAHTTALEEGLNQNPNTEEQNINIESNTEILGNKDDLIYFSIQPNAKVFGIQSYRGSVKGGYFFEGNILINILDANKNVLKQSNATATTEWMTVEPVDFEGNLDFTGLPKGLAYIEIHNDNASGLPTNEGTNKSILIPIIID